MFDSVKISQLPEAFSIVSKDYLVINVDDKVSSKLSYQNFLDTLTSENLIWDGNLVFTGNVVLPEGTETDPLFVASPAFTITQEDIDRWNEAYSWGDHALENYLKAGDIPTGFLMPGDNVSLLANDPPYVTKSELDSIIDGLDFITLDELNIIIDGHGYIKPGDPVSLLVNDVPYLTESELRCILDGYTAACNPDPDSRGYLKRAVNGIPIDKVSELENDVPYLTEASFINVSKEFLWRRDADGNFRDDNIELANGMGYLEHTWDGAPLIDYDIEILSNVNADSAVDGEVLAKDGDEWVPASPMLGLSGLHFEGAVDVGTNPTQVYTTRAVVVQHHVSELPRIAQPTWNLLNPTATREVQEQQYMILLESGQWVLCGQWNDQLQTDWLQADVWHPAYLRNKPTKLSDIDPNLPDVVGDGKITISGGDAVKITGAGGTANQTADTNQKIDIIGGDGITIDGNGINVEWDNNVGDGAINLIGGTGIIVRHNQVETPHANQYCDTNTIIELAAPFSGFIGKFETIELVVGEKADLTYVDAQLALKADLSYVDAQLALKADLSYVDAQLALKADLSYVDTELSQLSDAVDLKADTTYVDTELSQLSDAVDLKADLSYVNAAIENLGDVLNFKGVVDFTTTAAPANPSVGDVYSNSTDGTPDVSWGLAGDVTAGDMYGRGAAAWGLIGASVIDFTGYATEEYVNSELADKADANYVDSTFVKLSGGTMTGQLMMWGGCSIKTVSFASDDFYFYKRVYIKEINTVGGDSLFINVNNTLHAEFKHDEQEVQFHTPVLTNESITRDNQLTTKTYVDQQVDTCMPKNLNTLPLLP